MMEKNDLDRQDRETRRLGRTGKWCIVLVLTAVGAVQWQTGAFDEPLTQLALGAGSPPLVKAGDWHRLITPGLLHADVGYLAISLFLIIFGSVEFHVGTRGILLVFLTSCFGGIAASLAWTSEDVVCGALMGTFGLVGTEGAIVWREGRERWWTWSDELIGRLAPFMVALVGLFADLGYLAALVTGITVTVILRRAEKTETLEPDLGRVRSPAIAHRWLNGFCPWLCLLVLATSATAFAKYAKAGSWPLVERLLEIPDLSRSLIREVAWEVATSPEATREQLETAHSRMLSAKDEEPDVVWLNTLATLHYRLGDYDQAIELEREVLELTEGLDVAIRSIVWQLARFEWTRYREKGAIRDATFRDSFDTLLFLELGPTCTTQDEQILASLETRPGGSGIMIKGPIPFQTEIHAVLLSGDEVGGFVRFVVHETEPDWIFCDVGVELLDCDTRVVVTLAESNPSISAEGPTKTSYWYLGKEVADSM